MLAEYPSTEILLYNKLELLNEYQRCQYDLMARVSNILNRTISGKTDPITGKCIPMPFIEFLDRLYSVINKDLNNSYENEWVILDDFMQIAEFCYSAVKHLVDNPSHILIREEANLPVNKTKRIDGKVMQWLARRPGATVQEKVAPEFKVRATRKVFSVNTKENQELKYLYKILYNAIRVRINGKAVSKDDEHYRLLHKMLMCNMKIRKSELNDVPARKQSLQNNKLMCDQNYKIIWDATQKITKLENDLMANWMSLKEQTCQLAYWCFLAVLRKKKQVIIPDALGYLRFKSANGKNKLAFLGDEISNCITPNDSCCRVILPYVNEIHFMDVRLKDNKIECSEPIAKSVDINEIFDSIEERIAVVRDYERIKIQYEKVPNLLSGLVIDINKILLNKSEKMSKVKSFVDVITNIINNRNLKEVATDEKEKI